MDKERALEILESRIKAHSDGRKYVERLTAALALGDRMQDLENDVVRRYGPKPGTFHAHNVLTFMESVSEEDCFLAHMSTPSFNEYSSLEGDAQ